MDTKGGKIPLWLDCDPGHDDAFAILLAAHHPHLNLLGISTIHGNSSLENTTWNATSLLTAMGSTHIPVYAGSASGLVRPAVHAPSIHGTSGLDGTVLPTPTFKPRPEPAIDAMAEALLATSPGTAWLVATGAFTNIALVFRKFPHLAEHLKGLSIMGGAIGNFTSAILGKVGDRQRIGNWSPWGEFNVLVDPEAAAELFQNPVLKTKIALSPLDLTHLVLATDQVQELLLKGKDGKANTRLRTMLVELLTFFAKTYSDVFGISDGPPLHDPLAVAVILDGIEGVEIPFYDFSPQGSRERFEIKIVTEGSHEDALQGAETGRTIAKSLPEGQEGVKIPRGLDVDRFWAVLENCLEAADQVNRERNSG